MEIKGIDKNVPTYYEHNNNILKNKTTSSKKNNQSFYYIVKKNITKCPNYKKKQKTISSQLFIKKQAL